MVTHLRGIGLASAIVTAIATSILPIESTLAQSSQVYCESNNFKRTTCPIDTNRGVELVDEDSQSSCDDNWGVGKGYVWVDDGCRARFRAVSQRNVQYERRSEQRDRDERESNSRDYYENLNKIYREVLDRDIDSRGYRTYSKKLREGWSLSRVRKEVVSSREAREAINRIYQEILGRDADSQGLRTYQKRLEDDWSLRRVRKEIANSREARERRRQ